MEIVLSQGACACVYLCLLNLYVASFQILGYFDYAFTAIFTVEILLKVNVCVCLCVYVGVCVSVCVLVCVIASTDPRLC